MSEPLPARLAASAHDLGPQMEPALVDACEGRLKDVHWFRTDWQRGGAATGYATALMDGGPERDVVVKLPVGPAEYRVATRFNKTGAPIPGLAFHGLELGGWDLAWLVMERLPGDPLAAHLHKSVFEELATAAAGFYAAGDRQEESRMSTQEWDWAELLEQARESARINPIPQAQSWANHVHDVQRCLDKLLLIWNGRDVTSWCHGDLHPGNLMRREEDSPWGDACCVLLDFGESHLGHWVEDAVYLERIYWAKPEALKGVKPVSLIAKARRKAGLSTEDNYAELANVRRVLMAAVAPAFLHREGHPKYLEAALGVLDRVLPTLTK
ncbi:MAG: phosphotransferase [Planctomycetota bacterium]